MTAKVVSIRKPMSREAKPVTHAVEVTEAVGGARVTLYGLPQCDTCRKARSWLKRADIAHDFVDYRAQPIDGSILSAWAAAVGWDAMINRAGTTWRGLAPARKSAGCDAEWILLLRDFPALMKRPAMVIDGDTPTFGFSDAAFKRRFA